jgi:hypothetical protein
MSRAWCPNCNHEITPNALDCEACGARFEMDADWRPTDAAGKRLSLASRPELPTLPGSSDVFIPEPSFRAANDGSGCLAVLGRLLFGGLALLFGLLCSGASMQAAWSLAMTARWPYGDADLIAMLGITAAGAGLLSFACWQAVQLGLVGNDAEYDDRLWAQLSPLQRGRQLLLRRYAYDFGLLLWAGISAALFGVLGLGMLIAWFRADRLTLGQAASALTLCAFCCGMFAWRWQVGARSRERAELASGVVGTVPVSRNQWEAVNRAPSPADYDHAIGRATLLLVLALTITVWLVLPHAWPAKRGFWMDTLVSAGLLAGICGLATLQDLPALRMRQRYGDVALTFWRAQDQPLILAGEIRFTPPLTSAQRGEHGQAWQVRLGYEYGYSSTYRGAFGRIANHAPLIVDTDGARASFSVIAPELSNYAKSQRRGLDLDLLSAAAPNLELRFTVPHEVQYAVELLR